MFLTLYSRTDGNGATLITPLEQRKRRKKEQARPCFGGLGFCHGLATDNETGEQMLLFPFLVPRLDSVIIIIAVAV